LPMPFSPFPFWVGGKIDEWRAWKRHVVFGDSSARDSNNKS